MCEFIFASTLRGFFIQITEIIFAETNKNLITSQLQTLINECMYVNNV